MINKYFLYIKKADCYLPSYEVMISGLSYSVDKSNCGLGFDFARVLAPRPYWQYMPLDQLDYLQRWQAASTQIFFAYGNRHGEIHLIAMLGFSFKRL